MMSIKIVVKRKGIRCPLLTHGLYRKYLDSISTSGIPSITVDTEVTQSSLRSKSTQLPEAMSKPPAIVINNTEELSAEDLLSDLNDLLINDRKDARRDRHPAGSQYDMSFRHADDYGKKFLEIPKPSNSASDSEAARAYSSTKASSEAQCESTATESIDRNGQKLAVQSAPRLSESDRKTDVLGLGV
ncbi:hypothetical protein HER10_EVM0013362 [Colletotrichum scovillei]|nr:uncharacterized protein HER10_EVM0013362 [Colletotrichum scovillei]KAF4783747.1 hypothetical protein HER10_EVM0013362 [Colletotrichum scovillei]